MASHRRPSGSGHRDRRLWGTSATVLSAAAAAAALAAAPAGAAPLAPPAPRAWEKPPAADGQADVDRLYREAERATEAYDRATEHKDRLAAQVTRAQDGLARGQQRVNALRGALGALAGAQYRSGGVDPAVRLLLTSGPDGFLDRATALDRAGARAAGRLRQVRTLSRSLAQDRAEAEDRLAELQDSRRAMVRHKRTVEHKLAEARRLLNALPAVERAAYGRSGAAEAFGGPAERPASGRAAAAFAAVRSVLGRPYVWGADGPSAFDCSGLMQWAYRQAGVGLPRTSQEQRHAGRQVSLSQARPGDLVTYRQDASHVAMYAGHGLVIHAPHPGAVVRYDPVGMLPVSAVTRV